MGMLDRDYYQERWLKNVLGVDKSPRSIAAISHRLRRARAGVPLWPFVTLAICIACGFAFAWVVTWVRHSA